MLPLFSTSLSESQFGPVISRCERGIENVTISVHGHDDLGMAVANFMSAIEGGARQVRCVGRSAALRCCVALLFTVLPPRCDIVTG